MELPNLFAQPDVQDKNYLIVLLSECTVQAALLHSTTGSKDAEPSLEVKHRSAIHDYDTVDECVKATDRSLQELGKDSEQVDEVIFGFEPAWVTSAGIHDDRKPLLKRLTQDLALKAVGFVITTEAIFYHLKSQEPLISSLVLSVAPSALIVTLIKQGMLVGSETVGRSGEAAADIVEALARFKHSQDPGYIPSKFLMISAGVNQDELVAEQQALLEYDWITEQEFLQQPTVDILPLTTLIESVAHQGGRAVLAVGNSPPSTSVDSEVAAEEPASVLTEPAAAEAAEFGQELGFESVQLAELPDSDQAEELAVDETVANVVPASLTAVEKAVEEPHRAATFGIPLSGNAWQKWQAEHQPEELAATQAKHHHESNHHGQTKSGKQAKNPLIEFWHHHRQFVLLGLGLGLVTWIGLSWLLLGQLVRAQVVVTPQTQTLSQDIKLILDPKAAQSDPEKTILAAKATTKELTGQKIVNTAGIKVVGELAKGKVTLVNKTDSVKTFAAGTVLTAGQLSFALDKEVTVASASVSRQGSDGETKTYGKTEATITARAVGEASNIAANTELKVADFASSTYAATTVQALSGGSSREARVVSQKDRDNAVAELKKSLLSDASKAWESDSSAGTYYVPTGVITLKDAEYSHKVGEEAETLTITAVGVAEALAYQAQDLEQVAQAVLQKQVPAGFQLQGGSPQLLSSPAESSSRSATVSLDVNISKVAVAQLDQSSWLGLIAGKTTAEATTTLQQQTGVKAVVIELQPAWLQAIIKSLPKESDQVTIQVASPKP